MYFLPCLRVSSFSGCPVRYRKCTKANQLQGISHSKRVLSLMYKGIDDQICFIF